MVNSSFLAYIKDTLEPLGSFNYKGMFGGYGIYQGGVIFALIIGNELYFKADNEAEQFYGKYDSSPFTYQGKNGLVKMNYYRLPSEVLEDEDLLRNWFDVAWLVAKNAKMKKVKA